VIGKILNKSALLFAAIWFGILLPTLAIPQAPPTSRMTQQVWNLKDADIRAIIQTVSMITGKNFIIDPRVQGKVTFISQHPMSVNELYNAFLSMLQVLNYSAVPGNGVVRIVPSVDANSMNNNVVSRFHPGAGDELVVRVVPINNVSAIQLIPVLRPLMPQWSSITAYSPSNSLILASTAANVNHLVKIIKKMDSRSENETSLITLKHANADNIVSVITKLQSGERALGKTPNVSVAADKLSNTILISGNLNNISTMKALIAKMDDRARNTSNSAKVIYLNYLSAKKLAPVLNKIATGQASDDKGKTAGSTGDEKVSVQAEPDNDNAIIVRAPTNIMTQIASIVKRLDVKPQQVLVQAIIVKINESLLKQLGIVWGTVQQSGTSDTGGNPTTSTSPSNSFALKLAPGGVGFMQNSSLQVLIHALNNDGSTDILSTPSIVVLNGQKATISDGQNVGLVNREYSNSNATNTNGDQNLGVPFNTIQRKDVTLSLTVTPQISPNHTLRMKIVQKDDSLATQATDDPNNDNPVIDTSNITTNVLVKSGSILVLGGLVDHQAKRNDQKIPVLGDIPLIGRLFRYVNHDIEKKDLMVFLKPIIINTDYERKKVSMKHYHAVRRDMIATKLGPTLGPNQFPVLPNLDNGPVLPRSALPEPAYTRMKRHHHD
jgi:general secretion pathway protein D